MRAKGVAQQRRTIFEFPNIGQVIDHAHHMLQLCPRVPKRRIDDPQRGGALPDDIRRHVVAMGAGSGNLDRAAGNDGTTIGEPVFESAPRSDPPDHPALAGSSFERSA